MSDLFIDIPADAQARHHLLMITSVMVLCAAEEEAGNESPLRITGVMSAVELQALMKRLQATPAEKPIRISEREFVLLHGCCLLSSRLLLHERGEDLMAPFVAHLAATRPESGIDYALLRKYLLLHNEQLARRSKKVSDLVPSMRVMEEAIEALAF